MKRINSRQKGARCEREAAKFLASLGYPCSRMGRNGRTAADLDLSLCKLRNVHIECKGRETMRLGSKALDDAMEQAHLDSNGMGYAVIWKRNRTCWRLSYVCPHLGHRVTVDTPDGIAAALRMLNDVRSMTDPAQGSPLNPTDNRRVPQSTDATPPSDSSLYPY